MEKKLKQLFDYQKFARNPRLDAMMEDAELRCAALDEDALGMVSAAGETTMSVPVLLPPECDR